MQVFERILNMVKDYTEDLVRQKKEAINNNSMHEVELIEAELAGIQTVLSIAMIEMMKEDIGNIAMTEMMKEDIGNIAMTEMMKEDEKNEKK